MDAQFEAFLKRLEKRTEQIDSLMRDSTPMAGKGYHVGVYLSEVKHAIDAARKKCEPISVP
jgi:hypothetical protein